MLARSLTHPAPSQPAALPLLAKGFRPFFLLAALQAVVTLPVWLAVLSGWGPDLPLGPMVWHAHEMVFGFTVAVIAGFLLTAAGNWTGRETARGPALAGLCVLWLVGRVACLVDAPPLLGALACASFYVALGVALGRPLLAAKNRRNYGLLLIVLALGACDAATHLGALMPERGLSRLAPLWAVDLVVVMMVLVSGRIVPMFTRNALGDPRIVNEPWLDRGALAACVLVAACGVLLRDVRVTAAVSLLAGVLVLARARRWGGHRTLGHPLLWILHAGHAFIAVGLLLRAASGLIGGVPSGATLHALTAGAIGCLTLGMMSRVTLGHTGRMLAAPTGMSIAFAAVALGATVRILAPLTPSVQLPLLVLGGGAWSLGFLGFLLTQAPMLARPRVDGRPG